MSFHPSKYIDEYYFKLRDSLTVILMDSYLYLYPEEGFNPISK